MSATFTGEFLIALRKAPSKRTQQDIQTLQKTFKTLSSLKSRPDSELLKYSTKARYEYYPPNSILFKKGDEYTSWFILLSGAVFSTGSVFYPPACFGQEPPAGGSSKRPSQCYTVEPSELIVIDTERARRKSSTTSVTPTLSPSRPHVRVRSSIASNDSPSHSDYYSYNLNFEDNGDSDGEEGSLPNSLRSSCPSLLIKDQALDALEKQKDERTEEEIDMLHEFLQVLPAFNNLTGPVRRELCRHMVYVSVEEKGQTVLGDGEELDSWAVLLSGKVELRHLDGRKELLEVGKSFGVTPSLEKQYHRGTLVSLEPDAQFVCIEQAQYYDILHRGRENMIDVLDQVTGEVCLVKEKRMDGPVAIRGTPKALLTYLLEHDSKADKFFIEDFLLMSRIFLQSLSQIGDTLLQWFEQPSYRRNVTRVVSLWVNEHFCDFDTNRELLTFLESFERRLEEENLPQERDLLHLVCESKPRERVIKMVRKDVEGELFFKVMGGAEKGYPLYVSSVDAGSPADSAGLKRGDMILAMNDRNFETMSYEIAMKTMKRHTDMTFSVRTNLFGFKKMAAEIKHQKSTPKIMSSVKEPKVKKTSKSLSSWNIFGTKKNQKEKPSILPNPPKFNKSAHGSIDSRDPEADQDFQDLPDVEAIKIFRSDQTYKYLSITKETTAKEVVRMALREFGYAEDEIQGLTSDNEPQYSLSKVSCQDVSIKQSRFPDQVADLSSKISLNERYYLKALKETAPLVPDYLAPELVKESHISFLDLSTYELAFQLTIRDYNIFRNVLPTDYVNDIFHRIGGQKDPSHIKEMNSLEALVNEEMFWVVHEVLQETNLHRRANSLKQFIQTCIHLKELKNYNSLFAIISGLDHTAVARLKQTWTAVSPKNRKKFEELKALMEPSRNFSTYRSLKQKNEVPPLIPFVPVVKKDLTFIHLGNDTKVEGLINFEKMRDFAREIRTLRKYCEPMAFHSSYSQKNDSALSQGTTLSRKTNQSRMLNPEKLYKEKAAERKVKQYLEAHWSKIIKDEDSLMAVSKNLEPPPAPASTTSSRKSTGDNLSVSSSPGISIRHKSALKQQQPSSTHSRGNSEPVLLSPMISVTKGNNRKMVPVTELPKFGADSSRNYNKLMSLAEPPVGTNVSRYGGDRRRYRSGQSDSSANTNSTSYTNNSAPVISSRVVLAKPPLPPSKETSHKVKSSEAKLRESSSKQGSRPVSEHIKSLTLSSKERKRQRSVDQSRESDVTLISTKPLSGSNRSNHRSTPDLFQAPINPIYQPAQSRDATFVTKI
ncbi:Oidioi.mRNA.OKI2018_I69.XSR.g13661.t3.cds [Oikopleura dioica]|uniref:Oidioi.mRNA.OKI2018_I69.XSR.g13661.t3.cds n=1 Tax=Oikopleura dioica TaxID=34765 RepID=A0ABN7SDM9_OIKDI|nr:Oidioi.mRNA.OKI2018_I69.XSR.g13661.t3.cds [Oikopleura dioica]